MSTAAIDSAAIVHALHSVEIAPDALSGLAAFLVRHRFDVSRPLVLSGPGPSQQHGRTVAQVLRQAGGEPLLHMEVGGGLESALALAQVIVTNRATLVLGVGGGRVLDVAKYAACHTGVTMVAVPTSLAHDGIYSPVASLLDVEGVRRSLGAAAPAGLLLDTSLVAAAPASTRRAGVGDLLSNVTAVLDWRLAERCRAERFVEESADLALAAVQGFVDVAWSPDPVERVTGLAHGLVLSGLAMTAAGTSRPCSGAEHLVSHSLDGLLGRQARPHGEQVALGTLLSLAAHQMSDQMLRELFETVSLATHPAQLGLSDELFRAAVQRAPGCRPGRYTVLSEITLDFRGVAELKRQAYR